MNSHSLLLCLNLHKLRPNVKTGLGIAAYQQLQNFTAAAFLTLLQLRLQSLQDVDDIFSEQINKVVQRNARFFQNALAVIVAFGRIEGRNIVDIRLRALLRKERQGNLVHEHEFVHGGFGIVEQTDKAQASRTLRGAGIDLAFFEAWVTEDALLGLA